MKIAFIIDTIEPFYRGGYEHRAWALARRIAIKHETWVFTSCEVPTQIENIRFIPVGPASMSFNSAGYRRPSKAVLFTASLMRLLTSSYQFDIVDCNATPFIHVPAARALSRRWHAKFVLTAHEALRATIDRYLKDRLATYGLPALGTRAIRRVYDRAMSCPDLIVSASNFAAEGFLMEGFSNVEAIVAGIETVNSPKLDYQGRATFVGRLVATKRVDVLIRAFAEAARHNYVKQLTIVGSGPQRDELGRLAVGLGCANLIRFTGEIPDSQRNQILEYETDVFVSASLREGISIATLEAMSYGSPVLVCSDGQEVNGSLEYVLDGENGFVADGSSEDLFTGFKRFAYLDRALYNSFSVASLRSVEPYTWDSASKELETLYYRLLAEA